MEKDLSYRSYVVEMVVVVVVPPPTREEEETRDVMIIITHALSRDMGPLYNVLYTPRRYYMSHLDHYFV